MSFKVDRSTGAGGSVVIALRGAIDESADLEALFNTLKVPATFNLRGIERINSIGIARWIRLFGNYTRAHKTIIEEVSYPIATQANNIARLFGDAEIRSTFAPYYCQKCGESRTVLLSKKEIQAATEAPAQNCAHCKSLMVFDELDTYFDFVKK
jgi:hypothetical protein